MPPRRKNATGTSSSTNRAVWTSTCDEMLLECLETQKEEGRMTSNSSWHKQAWTEAEKLLAGTELHSGGAKKTAESCHNCWTSLKKDYVAVRQLRDNVGVSGFGWDSETSTLTASPSVWTALKESHPKLVKWCKKPFPLYDTIHTLVVGTVALGDNTFHPGQETETGADDALDSPSPPQDDEDNMEEDNDANENDSQERESPPPQAPPPRLPPPPATPVPTVSRKRSAVELNDSVSSVKRPNTGRKPTAGTAIMEMSSSVRELAGALHSTPNAGPATPERRKTAVTLLEKNDQLTVRERVKALKIVRQDVALADMISSISEPGLLAEYIREEIQGDL